MLSPKELDEYFHQFMEELSTWAPEGIVPVDIRLMHSLGLLEEDAPAVDQQQALTHYFHVIETADRITLFNERYLIWIVPLVMDEEPLTYTLVAHTSAVGPRLELVLSTSGVYNSSRIVLQVLERMLEEIEENEDTLARLTEGLTH